ncbi:MAG: hypothetical protein HY741_27425 [Chloroflexi bacterium]|nr:hypothetical protein [Chloroflexota bacterium]
MKILEVLALFILGFGSVALVGWLLLFHPEETVRSQGRMLRLLYKTLLGMSDDAIAKRYQLPTDKFFMSGSQSVFINQASEHPERFPRAVTCARLFGCWIWGVLLLAIVSLAFGLLTGKQITINVP